MPLKTITKIVPVKSLQSLLKPQPNQDPLIDGLRGLSAIMIVIFHTLFAVYFLFKNRPELFQQYIDHFDWPVRVMFGFDKAVDIFFMISAYLLGKSLMEQKRKSTMKIGRFYISRFFRIYPLFLIALTLYSLGRWHLFEGDFWWNLIFLDNFMQNTIIPVGWSLSVEMQCYLVLPFVIWLAEKSTFPVSFFAFLLLLSVGLRAWIALSHPEVYQIPFHAIFLDPAKDYQYMDQMYYATPSRVSTFIVGLLWAAIALNAGLRERCDHLLAKWRIRPVLIFILSFMVWLSFYFPIFDARTWSNWPMLESLNLALVILHRVVFAMALLGLILILQNRSRWFFLFLSLSVFRVFSRLAFPVYLFHFPVIAIAWVFVLQTTQLNSVVDVTPLQTAFAALLALIMVAWMSLPLHFLIEKKGILLGWRLNKT